jgi:transposase
MKDLWLLQKNEHIDLFFSDESGFQLVPNLPYGWQPKGEYVRMMPRKGKNMSVFGLLGTDNRLISYPTEKYTNAAFIIQCLDDFVTKIERPTVVIMDNSPIHRAKAMMEKRKEWEDKDLFIFFLPKYSPHLNRIETVWRKVKYEWLKPKDYKSWRTFTKAVKNILASFGSDEYNIRFSEPYYVI